MATLFSNMFLTCGINARAQGFGEVTGDRTSHGNIRWKGAPGSVKLSPPASLTNVQGRTCRAKRRQSASPTGVLPPRVHHFPNGRYYSRACGKEGCLTLFGVRRRDIAKSFTTLFFTFVALFISLCFSLSLSFFSLHHSSLSFSSLLSVFPTRSCVPVCVCKCLDSYYYLGFSFESLSADVVPGGLAAPKLPKGRNTVVPIAG